ncbi:MAG TPA: DUF883 C-terminal domain-containing protein [Pyrinomonadaceae bacterium]|nr:DUF883 C-terminal domain-containing protein [Pyrinomonadaceae bacterium]
MSQNFGTGGSTPGQGTGGAGTGATDAGTTRDTGGTTGAGGTGQSMTTGGGGQSSGGGAGAGTAAGLAQTAQEYGQKIAGAASTARDYVSDKVSVVGDKLGELRNKDFSEVATEAKEYARQNPGQALLISAAAGFVLGLLIRGSRR